MRHSSKLGCSLECLPLEIPFDLKEPYDSSVRFAHARLVHKERIEDASSLLLESYRPSYDCMGDKTLHNLPIDCHRRETLGGHDQLSIDSC
jgi:hypothetical protein